MQQFPLTYFALVFVYFRTMESISDICSFLKMTSQFLKKVPMLNESNISLGGIIILLALFVQKYTKEQNVRVKECHFEHCDREPFLDWTVILHCTKRAHNKCKIGQWRLLMQQEINFNDSKTKGIRMALTNENTINQEIQMVLSSR